MQEKQTTHLDKNSVQQSILGSSRPWDPYGYTSTPFENHHGGMYISSTANQPNQFSQPSHMELLTSIGLPQVMIIIIL